MAVGTIEKPFHYFAYGPNMDTERMKERINRQNENPGFNLPRGSFEIASAGLVKGWRLVFNKDSQADGEGYANIIRDSAESVSGILYTIDQAAKDRLSHFEGYYGPFASNNHYIPHAIDVVKPSMEGVVALTYLADKRKQKDGLKPSREYLGHLLRGKDYLPKHYVKKLQRIETFD